MFSNNDVFEQWLDTEANSVLEKLKDKNTTLSIEGIKGTNKSLLSS